MRHSMIKKTFIALTAFFVILSLTTGYGTPALGKTSGNIQHIYDKAGLLSDSELNSLENMCTEYSEKDDLDIIILTHNDPNAVDGEIYIENFNDKMQYLDSVILLVDMSRRDVIVHGYGAVETSINPSRSQTIAEKVSTYLAEGDYSGAFKKYIISSDQYMNYVPIYFNPLLQLGVALIIGIIVVAVMAFNAGGRITVGGGTYLDSNHSGLIGRRDDYIRTHVTRIRKPQNNGGGGGGGISAGGLSHSSGRAKF